MAEHNPCAYIHLPTKLYCSHCWQELKLTKHNNNDPLLDEYYVICEQPNCGHRAVPYKVGSEARVYLEKVLLRKT